MSVKKRLISVVNRRGSASSRKRLVLELFIIKGMLRP